MKGPDIPARQLLAVFALGLVALSGPCCADAPGDNGGGSVFDSSSDTGEDAAGDAVERDAGDDSTGTGSDGTGDGAGDDAGDTGLPPIANDVVRAGQTGTLGHLIDGDTMDLIVGSRTFAVRLLGINAPECEMEQNSSFRNRCVRDDEFYGLGAYEALVAIVDQLGRDSGFVVSCDDRERGEACDTDSYDRALVYLDAPQEAGPSVDLGGEMVAAGAALSYTAFRSDRRGMYCRAEFDAQDAGRGMWQGRQPSEVITMMSTSTQNWYTQHNVRCDAAMEDL